MSTFITTFDTAGDGIRLAVKDLIDMEGVPTTAGCPAVADDAKPADRDAPCLAGARAAGARIVGKANLHELAFGASGVNGWFGTPANPLDPALVPGGSSSGSAVAVATGEADVAYGSDTGGSVRIPSACCGTVGLKTTHGRVSLDGVWPLASSFDTIGPMARDVAGVITGMQLLEPGFRVADAAPTTVGRVRGIEAHPDIDAAVDRLLATAEVDVVDVELPGWGQSSLNGGLLLVAEAYQAIGHLLEHRDRVGADVAARIEMGAGLVDQMEAARAAQRQWQQELAGVFDRVPVLALPTTLIFPPRVDAVGDDTSLAANTMPVNAAGVPALALPAPTGGPLPASVQLVGPLDGEEQLLALGRLVEAAAASL